MSRPLNSLSSFVVGLTILTGSASAQGLDSAGRADLNGIRQSLDQLVVVVRELVQQNARRDRVAALTLRIDSLTRRLAPREDELRVLREKRQREETEGNQLRGSLETLAEMAKQDTTGSAAQAIDTERGRLNAAIDQKAALLPQLANEIARLEASVAKTRSTLDELERALDRELGQR